MGHVTQKDRRREGILFELVQNCANVSQLNEFHNLNPMSRKAL